jgi:hypothetical protein
MAKGENGGEINSSAPVLTFALKGEGTTANDIDGTEQESTG